MSLRTILIVVLALTFGGSAAVGVNMLRKKDDSPKTAMVSVVVAAKAVPQAGTVGRDCVKTVEYPESLVPPGAITSVDEAVDRAALVPLVKDEVLVDSKLASKEAGRGLSTIIPKGMRAFTILTPNVAANLAGLILPGNKVDVLLTMNGRDNDGTGGASTTTLLQNIKILAVEQRTDAPPDNKNNLQQLQSVTLLVTPDQAAKLDLGQNRGTLHLTLRHPQDNDAAKPREATLRDLQGHQEMPLLQQAAEWAKNIKDLFPERKASAPEPEDNAPPAPLEIRTLRGRTSGVVQVEPLEVNAGR